METENTTPNENKRGGNSQREENSLRDWFTTLGSGLTLKCKLYRDEPKVTRQGKRCNGWLRDYNEPLEESHIKDEFGGGRYRLQAFRLNEKGNWVYYRQITIEIGGDAKMPQEATEETLEGNPVIQRAALSDSPSEEPSIVRQALAMTAELTREERQRARELEREARDRGGVDTALLAQLTKPLEIQLETLREELREARRQANVAQERTMEAATRKTEPGPTDRILEKMIEGDSARIQAIRVQHDSELRQLRESYEAGAKRLQDHYIEETRAKDRVHDREVDNLREAHKLQLESLKESQAARVDGLQGQIKRLESELDGARKELSELRAKKEVPIEEQLLRIAQLKEAMEAFGGAKDDEQPGVVGQILERIAPILEGVGQRIGNAPSTVEMPPAQPQGSTPAPGGQSRRPKPPQAAPKLPGPPIDLEDIKAAVAFAENAAKAETDPAQFAVSARSMLPGSVITFIREHGVDALLEIAKLDDASYLQTQVGRVWIRTVAKLLIEG